MHKKQAALLFKSCEEVLYQADGVMQRPRYTWLTCLEVTFDFMMEKSEIKHRVMSLKHFSSH